MKGSKITTIAIAAAILILILMATSQTPSASAHTVTARACLDAAIAQGRPFRPTVLRCENYRAIHNTCGHEANCRGWLRVAICETGDSTIKLTAKHIRSIRWRIDETYDGGLQFSPGTWRATGSRYSHAYRAPSSEQVKRAEVWRKRIGGDPHSSAGWPNCGRYF